MFYPVDTLKRGGKFYLCWVADSWPLRFATITHRQLWSQDIRKICDDLLEVITNESGRPINRFSLRLSSQLLRGLVRLYQRKASVLLGDLCMINALVIKHSNKKWIIQEDNPDIPRRRLPVVTIEHPEEEPRVEELIESSNNAVANIDDITLKEPTITEIQFLINDGFGELRSEVYDDRTGYRTVDHTEDRTVEQMLQASAAPQLSALELGDLSGDKSHDKSRPHATRELQMERISEYDVSMNRKFISAEMSVMADIEKEIPEIPEIPPPVLNVPEPLMADIEMAVVEQPERPVQSAMKRTLDDEIVLEELEAQPPKRRRVRRLVVDLHKRLGHHYMRDRVANNNVELRYQSAREAVVNIRIPSETYFLQPAHVGVSATLRSLYLRNLHFISKTASHRELEEAVVMPTHETRSHIQPIEVEPSGIASALQIEVPVLADVTEAGQGQGLMDFSDLQTQVIETLPEIGQRTSQSEEKVDSGDGTD